MRIILSLLVWSVLCTGCQSAPEPGSRASADATVTVNGSPVVRARGNLALGEEPDGHLQVDLIVPQPSPTDRAPWRALRRGMTPAEVERLLGSPEHVQVMSLMQFWKYPGAGEVTFSEDRLSGWDEPR